MGGSVLICRRWRGRWPSAGLAADTRAGRIFKKMEEEEKEKKAMKTLHKKENTTTILLKAGLAAAT